MDSSIPILYHYCSVESFFHIITSKSLRLSDLSYTNDSLELKWGRDKISRIYKEVFLTELNELVMLFSNMFEEGVYATCFSEDRDLLSQWRCYANDGKGVAIGFDIEKLSIKRNYPSTSSNINDSLGYEQVIYDELKQDDIIRSIINDMRVKSKNTNGIVRVVRLFYQYCNFFKNPSFKEEKEWRFLYYKNNSSLFPNTSKIKLNKDLSELKFQTRDDNINSFYEYSYEKYLPKHLLKEIVLGPKCKLDLLNLKCFLDVYGFSDVEINKSTASYR